MPPSGSKAPPPVPEKSSWPETKATESPYQLSSATSAKLPLLSTISTVAEPLRGMVAASSPARDFRITCRVLSARISTATVPGVVSYAGTVRVTPPVTASTRCPSEVTSRVTVFPVTWAETVTVSPPAARSARPPLGMTTDATGVATVKAGRRLRPQGLHSGGGEGHLGADHVPVDLRGDDHGGAVVVLGLLDNLPAYVLGDGGAGRAVLHRGGGPDGGLGGVLSVLSGGIGGHIHGGSDGSGSGSGSGSGRLGRLEEEPPELMRLQLAVTVTGLAGMVRWCRRCPGQSASRPPPSSR